MLVPRTLLARLQLRAKALLNHIELRLPWFSWSNLSAAYRYMQLVQTVRILRGRRGCPWDQKQTFADILPYLQEEVAEVYTAVKNIELGDPESFAHETGDLLFVVTFLVILCEEAGLFALSFPARTLVEKMIRRHPHVFSDAPNDTDSIRSQWKQIKQQELQQKQQKRPSLFRPFASVFDQLKPSMSPLTEAQQIGELVGRVGFDWPDTQSVWKKVVEEIDELHTEISLPPTPSAHISPPPSSPQQEEIHARQHEELGDLLFTLANLARHLNVDSTQSLRDACDKFRRRFQYMELQLHERHTSLESTPAESLEKLWQQAKAAESKSGGADSP